MIERIARDSLVIVVDGEEVPGLIFYGLSAPGVRRPGGFPSSRWPSAPEVVEFLLYGESWEVATWEMPVVIWPTGDQFVAAVRSTLLAMLDTGCRVAWVGAEGVAFCDPPRLFDPVCMSTGVLAWMTDDGAFDCPLDPDLPIASADDECLLVLRRHAQGLADAEV